MPKQFADDYPTEPIGGDNPYRRCRFCKKSVPAINYEVEAHHTSCEYRKWKLAHPGQPYPLEVCDDLV